MEMSNLAAIFIALIAAAGSWASHRASARAEIKNSSSNNRVEMEKEAYERARKLDTETITRQDEEMDEMRKENAQLKADNRVLHEEVSKLRDRISALERELRPTQHITTRKEYDDNQE